MEVEQYTADSQSKLDLEKSSPTIVEEYDVLQSPEVSDAVKERRCVPISS